MCETLSFDEWKDLCPVATTIEVNGFRLENYCPSESQILAMQLAGRLSAVVAEEGEGRITLSALDKVFVI